MRTGRTTLGKFVIEQLGGSSDQSDLGALLIDVAAAVKSISAMLAKGALGGYLGSLEVENVQGEVQKKLTFLPTMLSSLNVSGVGNYLEWSLKSWSCFIKFLLGTRVEIPSSL